MGMGVKLTLGSICETQAVLLGDAGVQAWGNDTFWFCLRKQAYGLSPLLLSYTLWVLTYVVYCITNLGQTRLVLSDRALIHHLGAETWPVQGQQSLCESEMGKEPPRLQWANINHYSCVDLMVNTEDPFLSWWDTYLFAWISVDFLQSLEFTEGEDDTYFKLILVILTNSLIFQSVPLSICTFQC